MKVLTAQQIKAWDAYTLQHEPVSSIDLMDRAAQQCARWLLQQFPGTLFSIICGTGNNGGDGLAITRILSAQGIPVRAFVAQSRQKVSADFETNLQRLQQQNIPICFITNENELPSFLNNDVLVDALYGIGLNGSPQGLDAALIRHMNASGAVIVSIDLPSGMQADGSSATHEVIRAHHTLTFQCYKTALLVAENAKKFGTVHVLDIGLHPAFLQTLQPANRMVEIQDILKIFKPRAAFSHKGTHGHAMILGGSFGKMGAVVLAASACLRTGAGLLTAYVPHCGYNILQTSVPEAMTITDNEERFIVQPPSELPKCNALGIGPGMGTDEATQKVVSFIIRRFKKPVVMDADGLNCISQQPQLLEQICRNTILTPHPKEFDRLFGNSENDFDRIRKAIHAAISYKIIIVLKGHHTLIALPDGSAWFNTTGNAGMAKGGSGDALTGIITSLLAQGYSPRDAAVMGVYLHGKAGDYAAESCSRESMTASDLIASLSKVFLELNRMISS